MYKHPMERMLYEEAGIPPAGAAPVVPPNITDGVVTAPPVSPEPPAGDNASKSWLESLPEDIRQDPSLQLFKEPAALAKSWVNAQKMIGADKVVIPGEKATEEEWNAFHQKLGRPASADKYEFKLPEGIKLDESLAKSVKEVAFKAGLNPKQLQALVEWDANNKIEAAKGQGADKDAEMRSALDAYQTKLGGEDKFNATIDKARVAVKTLADPEMVEFLRNTGMGSHPAVIAHFAKMADMMAEDKVRDGTSIPLSQNDPAAIQKEIDTIEEKMFKDLNSASMSSWVEQRNQLYTRLGGVRKNNA